MTEEKLPERVLLAGVKQAYPLGYDTPADGSLAPQYVIERLGAIAGSDALADIGAQPRFTGAYRPQTNGKVERFNRTLADEWAYARLWTSDARRARTLDPRLHRYNHHRHHTAIGGPPASRVTNLAGQNT